MILKHVLLCYPSHFRVDYVINPWMKIGSVNLALAELQWQQLVEAYKLAKIEVSIIKQHRSCPDMVFAADEGLAIFKNTLLLSKFRYPERQPETKFYDDWLTQHNFQLLKIPDTKFFFEGSGDCLVWKQANYFIGSGHRNSANIGLALQQLTGENFIQLDLIHPHFFHLDTCLFILDSDTAFYYPPAFSQSALTILQNSFKFLIKIPEAEANNFGLNSICHQKTVFIQKNNPFICAELRLRQFTPIEIDTSEFMKAGGGIHCLTQVLDYELDN